MKEIKAVMGNPYTDEMFVITLPEDKQWIVDSYIRPLSRFLHRQHEQDRILNMRNATPFSDFAEFSGWVDWATKTIGSLIGWVGKNGGKVASYVESWNRFLKSLGSKAIEGKFVYCQVFCAGKASGNAYRLEERDGVIEILPRDWTGSNPRINCATLPPAIFQLVPSCASMGLAGGAGPGGDPRLPPGKQPWYKDWKTLALIGVGAWAVFKGK